MGKNVNQIATMNEAAKFIDPNMVYRIPECYRCATKKDFEGKININGNYLDSQCLKYQDLSAILDGSLFVCGGDGVNHVSESIGLDDLQNGWQCVYQSDDYGFGGMAINNLGRIVVAGDYTLYDFHASSSADYYDVNIVDLAGAEDVITGLASHGQAFWAVNGEGYIFISNGELQDYTRLTWDYYRADELYSGRCYGIIPCVPLGLLLLLGGNEIIYHGISENLNMDWLHASVISNSNDVDWARGAFNDGGGCLIVGNTKGGAPWHNTEYIFGDGTYFEYIDSIPLGPGGCNEVRYLNGKYIMCGVGEIAYSSTGFSNWTHVDVIDSSDSSIVYDWRDICYVNGKYYLVGPPTTIATSSDLENWTIHKNINFDNDFIYGCVNNIVCYTE